MLIEHTLTPVNAVDLQPLPQSIRLWWKWGIHKHLFTTTVISVKSNHHFETTFFESLRVKCLNQKVKHIHHCVFCCLQCVAHGTSCVNQNNSAWIYSGNTVSIRSVEYDIWDVNLKLMQCVVLRYKPWQISHRFSDLVAADICQESLRISMIFHYWINIFLLVIESFIEVCQSLFV